VPSFFLSSDKLIVNVLDAVGDQIVDKGIWAYRSIIVPTVSASICSIVLLSVFITFLPQIDGISSDIGKGDWYYRVLSEANGLHKRTLFFRIIAVVPAGRRFGLQRHPPAYSSASTAVRNRRDRDSGVALRGGRDRCPVWDFFFSPRFKSKLALLTGTEDLGPSPTGRGFSKSRTLAIYPPIKIQWLFHRFYTYDAGQSARRTGFPHAAVPTSRTCPPLGEGAELGLPWHFLSVRRYRCYV
jgi:hypothetical protein